MGALIFRKNLIIASTKAGLFYCDRKTLAAVKRKREKCFRYYCSIEYFIIHCEIKYAYFIKPDKRVKSSKKETNFCTILFAQ